MRKDELVSAISRASKSQASKSKSSNRSGKASSAKATTASRSKSGSHSKSRSRLKSGSRSKSQPSATANHGTAGDRSRSTTTAKGKVANKAPAKSKATAGAIGAKKPTAKKSSSKSSARATPAASRPSQSSPAATSKIAKAAVPKKAISANAASKAQTKPTPTSPKVLKKIRELQLQRESGKDIAFRPTLVRPPGAAEPIWEKEPLKDRIGLFVRDPYWLHASWDITRNAVERARAAMAEQWHNSKPVLRLLKLDDTGTSSSSETVERHIEIHGGLRNWYIPWTGEPTSFRVLVGYLSTTGRFHAIAKSNIVKTAAAGAPDATDEHWSDVGAESERIFALSGGYDAERETRELKEMLEERVHRKLGAPALAKLGAGAEGPFRRRGEFHFDMEIEMVVYGSTMSDGYLTLNGEPVTLRSDGTFAVRLPFPDRRQVLPAVACTRDGTQQRTIVVAVERNTKIMEPLEQERDTGE